MDQYILGLSVTNCPKQIELLRKGPYHVQLSYLHLFLPFIQKKKATYTFYYMNQLA